MLDFTTNHGQIEVCQTIPEEFKKFHQAGAHPVCLRADFATLLFQQMPGDGFEIWYSLGEVFGNGNVGSRGADCALELRIGLQGQLEGEWDGIKAPGLLPSFCNVSFTPYIETNARFRKNNQYAWLDIQFHQWFLEDFAEDHPQFNYFLESVDTERPAQLGKKDFPCTPRMKRIVNEILNCPYHTGLQKNIRHSQVTALLVEVFQMAFYDVKPPVIILKSHHEEQLDKAYSYIMSNSIDNPLSNGQLCKKFNLTEETLLKGFRDLYNISPQKLTRENRFQEAERLLLEGESPEKVSYIAGFKHSSSFYPAFLERNKCTPAEFQKMKGKK